MAYIFERFWWLIFPVMSFGLVGFRRWMRYKRQHDAIELLRTYAVNGREPPPEVLSLLSGPAALGGDDCGPGRDRHAQGLWGATFILGALAGGFFVANTYVRSDGGFAIAGVILGSLSVGMLMFAVTSTYFERRR